MNAQIQALDDYMNMIDGKQVDDLVYDETEETLQLYANGIGVGNKVSVRDMLDDGAPVVDFASTSASDSDKEDTDNDNVIEF